MNETADYDIIVIGAGPTGLAFAASLRNAPLRVALIDRLSEAELQSPPYDGREIALTQPSIGMLRELGIWERLPPDEISALHAARVLNAESPDSLFLRSPVRTVEDLGCLVSNHWIRRTAYEAVRHLANTTLLSATAQFKGADTAGAHVSLGDGRSLRARLVVAADTRFSESRRAIGIGARLQDFGKSMLVCRMTHEIPHQRIAWEWFGHRQTLALLPLNGDRSSVVLTLPHASVEALCRLSPADFALDLTRRFAGRLGAMTLEGERYSYPLVAVYPDRFVERRYAAIGDAAVGMHPVTAHGFNFGLAGQERLARGVLAALRRGADIGGPGVLDEYERIHRRATRPLYLATNAIVDLYTRDTLPARIARHALLALASRTPMVSRGISHLLMRGARGGADRA